MTCIPPPGTASGTTHVLRGPDGDVALVWYASGVWRLPGHEYYSPEKMGGLAGYRYIAPLTPPDEVARLREALREIALQFLESEMDERDRICGDYRYAYAEMIKVARVALENRT